VPRLSDHERRPRPDDPCALPEDDLQSPRVLLPGEIPRLRRRHNVAEAHDLPLCLGDNLVCDHDDVPVLDLGVRRQQAGDVVALTDLRQPFDRDDA
jgi:hypothetical protein